MRQGSFQVNREVSLMTHVTLYIAHFPKIKKDKGTKIEGESSGYLWKIAPEILDADQEVAPT